MKKETFKAKRWRAAINIRKLRLGRPRKKAVTGIRPKSQTPKKHKTVRLPLEIDLMKNRRRLLACIAVIHKKANILNAFCDPASQLVFNFRPVIKMHADGTLLLLAEIKNARRLYRNIGSFVCIPPASNRSKQVMLQTGFGNVLSGVAEVTITRPDVSRWHVASGTQIDGDLCGKVIDDCLKDAAQDGLSCKTQLYEAASEAMANACEHAYIDALTFEDGCRIVEFLEEAWWMFASYADGHITVVFCDLGFGIPRTISIKHPGTWGRIIDAIWSRRVKPVQNDGDIVKNDAEIIKEILNDQKTRTSMVGRGQGLLQNIWRFAEYLDKEAAVTILSNKGECRHFKRRNQPAQQSVFNHTGSIQGTLISWRFPVESKEGEMT